MAVPTATTRVDYSVTGVLFRLLLQPVIPELHCKGEKLNKEWEGPGGGGRRTRCAANAMMGIQHSAPTCWKTRVPAAARSRLSVVHTMPNTGPGVHHAGSTRSPKPLSCTSLHATEVSFQGRALNISPEKSKRA